MRITKNTDVVVLELGANHLGEIKELCHIAKPTHGIITNLGRDHIGLFGSESAIIEANLELYTYLKNKNGVIFVNNNNAQLLRHTEGARTVVYGTQLKNEYGIQSLSTVPYISFLWNHREISTSLTGEYNIENINAAIAIAVECNILFENIAQSVSNYEPIANRSEIYTAGNGNIIIKDFYNANLTSMKLALENLKKIGAQLKKETVAIMGDMLELGEYSLQDHQAAVDHAKEIGITNVILVGHEFKKTNHEEYQVYDNVVSAARSLDGTTINNSIILLKASNGTNFQHLFDCMK